MAKEKMKKLDDQEEILPIVERAVCSSVGWNDSKLSKERERITRYYNGELPLRQNEGRSSYVSLDVYAAVEMMKAQLLETFSGNPDNLISFPPLGDNDLRSSRIATEYCSYQFWRLNKGFAICRDVIHDGLTARIGVVKAYWKKQHEDFEEEIPQAPLADVQAVAALDEVVELEAEEVEEGAGVFTGKLTRRVDTSQVCVDNVPPEEFLIDKDAVSIQSAGVVSHRTRKTRAELIDEGYDERKVNSISWSTATELDLTGEYLARTSGIGDAQYPVDDELQEETQKVMFYETYIKLDRHDGRGVRLYKVCHAGHILLDIEEVSRRPFLAYVPLPVPHLLYGNNYAARVVPTQNARTVLTRAILDHAAITTNPRWGVVKGGLMNPKEMLDNRLGGIVNMNRPDAVLPLPQHSLNPFVFQTIEMLKDSNEETTSISALSQGLNKDAISTQNSEGLVDNLVTLSGQRQKIMARAFADFLVELYLEIYRLVLENAEKEDIIEVAGDYEPVKVSDWVERKTCKVALHLGYGERDRYAAKLKTNMMMLAQDPGLQGMFLPQNRYDMAMDAMRADGLEGAAKYISTPDKIPPPQPDPLAVKELEIKDKQAQAALLTAQANAEKTQVQAQTAQQDAMLEQVKMAIDKAFKERDAVRKDFDSTTRAEIAHRELDILEAQPQETVTAVASPNS
jgi:hypothetical protein